MLQDSICNIGRFNELNILKHSSPVSFEELREEENDVVVINNFIYNDGCLCSAYDAESDGE